MTMELIMNMPFTFFVYLLPWHGYVNRSKYMHIAS